MHYATIPLSAKPKRDSLMDGQLSGGSSQSSPSPHLAPPAVQHLQQSTQPTAEQVPNGPLFHRADGTVFTIEQFAICILHAKVRHKLGILDPAARIQYVQMKDQHPGVMDSWFNSRSPQERQVLQAHQENAMQIAQAEIQARSTQQPSGPHPVNSAYRAQQMRLRDNYSQITPAQALSLPQRPAASPSQQAIPTAQMDPRNGQQDRMHSQTQALAPPGRQQATPNMAGIQAGQQYHTYAQAPQLDGVARTPGEAYAMADNTTRNKFEQELRRSQAAATVQPPSRPVSTATVQSSSRAVPNAMMQPPSRSVPTATMQPPSRPVPAAGQPTTNDPEVIIVGSRPRTQRQQPEAEFQQHRVASGRIGKATRTANTPLYLHPLPRSVEEEVLASPPKRPAFVKLSDLEVGTNIRNIHSQYAARAADIRMMKCLLDPSFAEQERLCEEAMKEHADRMMYVPEPTIEAARQKVRQSDYFTLKNVPFVTADTPKIIKKKSAKEKKEERISEERARLEHGPNSAGA
jgi:hypothetical protein